MDLRRLMNKLYLIFYRKIPYNEFINLFSGTLFVAGQTVDNVVLDFIDKIELDRIKKIVILTPLSNMDKAFTNSWSGLDRYLRGLNIDLMVKAPKNPIYPDIYFLDGKNMSFVPRICFENYEIMCCICKDHKKRREIMEASASAEDITSLRGADLYYKKFDRQFEIDKRKLSDDDKEKVLNALMAWENSNYEDIEPLWRVFEYKIRCFIKIRLSSDNQQNWFTKRVLSCFENKKEIIEGIMKRFEKNKQRWEVESLDEHPFPVEYLDAKNYETIIGNKNNRVFFSDYKDGSNRKYHSYIHDVIKARNAPIHARKPDEDADYFSDTISKLLMSLEWLNILESELLNY